jgi:hypothetical protein
MARQGRKSHALSLVVGKGYSGDVWEVDVELVDDWLKALDIDTYDQVLAALTVLANVGPGLGRPLVDTVVGSRHNNMKELRPGSSGRSEVRILFAFDPKRRAILLVAGDKQGRWEQWYKTNIPIADDRYGEHLDEVRKQDEARAAKAAKKAPPAKGRRKKDGK